MKLDTLYSRRSDGKLQSWTIEIAKNKYRTISGIQNGALVISEWTVCTGKNIGRSNETTPSEQALSEAKAHQTKKLDKGYKPLSFYESHEDEKASGKEFFQPMLAHDFKKQKDVEFPLLGQPKLDGVRATAQRGMPLISRQGKPFVSVTHIVDALRPLFAKHPNSVVDGELYADKLSDDFNSLVSLVKKQKPSPQRLKEIHEGIQYHVYDYLPDGNGSLPFIQRLKTLAQHLRECQVTPDIVVIVETQIVEDREDMDKVFADYVAKGYEGLILRVPESPYENKRSKNLLKFKSFIDEEFILWDVLEGIGNRSGMAGAITLKKMDGKPFLNRDGKPVKAGLRGNAAFYADLWKNRKKYSGKTVTVKHFGETPDGSIRFPVMVAIRDYE